MSGQPIHTQSDANKFRNEYMETLALQESINDMNLQANKTYLLTGQLPPQSQMQDTRTTAEKLADVEKLKRDIADNLRPIAEPQFAYQIVQKVIDSPLNLDNSLLRFLAQRATTLSLELSKILPYGIKGDANDLETIVSHIKNMYSSQQGKFKSTKSYLNSSESTTGNSKVLSANDMESIIIQLDDLIKNFNLLIQKSVNIGGMRGTNGILRNLMNNIIFLKDAMPTNNQLRLMMDDISNADIPIDVVNRKTMEAFFSILEKLPKYNEVISLIGKIKNFIASDNKRMVSDGIKRLKSMFDIVDIRGNIGILNEFRELVKIEKAKEQTEKDLHSTQTRAFIEAHNKEAKDMSKANKVYVVNTEENPVWVRGSIGEGLKKKRLGRPRGSGVRVPPPPKIPNFVGFGINEINQKSLDKGILTIRRNTKSNIIDLPSRRVSNNFKTIMKTILGGGMPKYEELGKLDNDEKDYLYKLVEKSNLQDRLTVPAPSKDQQEKDIHNFEVLKGQIMSGNDSQELVKKFKLLVRKLSKQGLLPRAEVEDLLETLMELGY